MTGHPATVPAAQDADTVLRLDTLRDTCLPATLKGLPSMAVEQPLTSLGRQGFRLLQGDVPLPAAVLKESALAHNLNWMRDFSQRAGVSLCPHGKTTMAPQLFERQLAAGAWGMTAATASHVRTYRQFGVSRIVLANQLIGEANIGLIFDELERDATFDFYCLVDSLAGLERLLNALDKRPLRRPLQVLLEIGIEGGRAGVRSHEAALQLGRMIKQAQPRIVLRGIEAFEGIIGGADIHQVEQRVQALLRSMAELTRIGCEEDWYAPGDVIVTAGGSSFFDLVSAAFRGIHASRVLRPILRSGCYITHDSLHFAKEQPRMRERSADLWGADAGLRNALEVWAEVQSVPEQRRAICALGKRDISYDMTLPQPISWFRPGLHNHPQPVPDGLRMTGMNDQHAFVDCDALMPWQVGDLVGFGVAHPCTTFDKWPLMLVIDDDYQVIDGIRTFF